MMAEATVTTDSSSPRVSDFAQLRHWLQGDDDAQIKYRRQQLATLSIRALVIMSTLFFVYRVFFYTTPLTVEEQLNKQCTALLTAVPTECGDMVAQDRHWCIRKDDGDMIYLPHAPRVVQHAGDRVFLHTTTSYCPVERPVVKRNRWSGVKIRHEDGHTQWLYDEAAFCAQLLEDRLTGNLPCSPP
jgi:hypothetical protein